MLRNVQGINLCQHCITNRGSNSIRVSQQHSSASPILSPLSSIF